MRTARVGEGDDDVSYYCLQITNVSGIVRLSKWK